MINKLFAMVLLVLTFQAHAQNERKWIAVETDPMTTLFGAKTLSALFEPPKMRHWSLFTNAVAADFPVWMEDFLNPKNKGQGFDTQISFGGGFAVDYFLKPEREGYYFGIINLLFNTKVQSGATTDNLVSHNIITRLGYRWYPLESSGFYLNPFVGIRYEYLWSDQALIENKKYEAAGFGPFGTVHIGYHF